jgi:hypothetical protein
MHHCQCTVLRIHAACWEDPHLSYLYYYYIIGCCSKIEVLVVSTTLFFDDHDIIATKKTVAAAKSGDYRCICCRSGTYDSWVFEVDSHASIAIGSIMTF